MQNGEADSKVDVERVPASEARDRLTELMNRASFRGERFILTRNGEDLVALIAAQELERLRALDTAANSAAA